ncbi:hypothetical protein [Rhodococcus chondri]|uniref:DUF2867 domain-containing protein n=1 Tax=Rhodococcus chondri TaxID=3065941 RepID=A0ABU7JLI9_9NOCA|nr:hypothetical protein [Rhodococcus sp. CC-R104]MEE2030906.1 hypothetical protein [Rhodococcus sp. CC-R104]
MTGAFPTDLLDVHLPAYDVVLTEHLTVEADVATVFRAAQNLDFLTVRTPLLATAFFIRGLPARLSGKPSPELPALRLFADPSSAGLPGWLVLGQVADREIAFGAVGKFWQADIEWRDVPLERFAGFDEPGWGKIGCHFLVRANGEGRSVVSYECRTATTDPGSRKKMMRYWWIIRPFVGHIMRATLRTIAADAH